jgi:hypothetical protein
MPCDVVRASSRAIFGRIHRGQVGAVGGRNELEELIRPPGEGGAHAKFLTRAPVPRATLRNNGTASQHCPISLGQGTNIQFRPPGTRHETDDSELT